jgi:hypothetical protein
MRRERVPSALAAMLVQQDAIHARADTVPAWDQDGDGTWVTWRAG